MSGDFTPLTAAEVSRTLEKRVSVLFPTGQLMAARCWLLKRDLCLILVPLTVLSSLLMCAMFSSD